VEAQTTLAFLFESGSLFFERAGEHSASEDRRAGVGNHAIHRPRAGRICPVTTQEKFLDLDHSKGRALQRVQQLDDLVGGRQNGPNETTATEGSVGLVELVPRSKSSSDGVSR